MNRSRTLLLPALLAAGSGMGSMPASALELGELVVDSTLGQPLRASIAYALAPNEALAGYCIALVPARAHHGVPAINQADVSVANGVIRLSGSTPVMEPLVSLVLRVDCPYAANLSREYTAFVDPALTAPPAPAVVAAPSSRAARPAAPIAAAPTAAPASRIENTAAAPPVAVAARYQVQRGDTLSGIAQRIENRGVSLWDAVEQIHAANPNAFIDNDPNQLKAGTWLDIPVFAPGSRFVAEPVPAPATVASALAANNADATASPAVDENSASASTAGTSSASASMADAQPGDVVIDGRTLSRAPTESVLIDNQDVTSPAATSPNVPVARIAPEAAPGELRRAPADTSLWWMIGGGFLLLGGLAWLGLRARSPGRPAPGREADARDGRDATTLAGQPALDAVVADDYELDDDSPTSENLALDADLVVGTGLSRGDEIHVAEDFGFDTSADLDLEFPAGDADADDPETDIIPPPRIEQSSILENEVLPDDDDYDMSIVMDVTKVPDPVEVTERDLKAVPVRSDDDTRVSDSYTVSQEVDYQVLEQDYEDELSATQALNLEIEKAVADLAHRLDAEILEEHSTEATSRVSLANVTAFNSLPANAGDDDDDTSDLEVTSSLEEADLTISEVPTARLPAVDDDSIEITIESGKLDTKAG